MQGDPLSAYLFILALEIIFPVNKEKQKYKRSW